VYEIVEPYFEAEVIRPPLGRLYTLASEWDGDTSRTDDQLRRRGSTGLPEPACRRLRKCRVALNRKL